MNMLVVGLVILFIHAVISYYIIHSYKKKLFMQCNTILQRLDQALAGKKLDHVYDETLDSAIRERLNRMIEITEIQKGRAEAERDIVKSLISDISHQVRTPLASIMLYTGLLKEQLSEEKERRLSDKIEKNAEKLDFFIKELIRSSYAQQELIVVHPRVVDIDEIIKRGCQAAETAARRKNIQITVNCHGYSAYADPDWTEEVLGNVIENAVKYSQDGTTVQADSVMYESFVCIRIKDEGIGLPEEEQGKVFQRFYRASNVRDRQGFGIGLYLAREVLSRQQGYIKLKSAVNQGTVVEIFLLNRSWKPDA